MVNPERRATLEEIARHWWLNWGYQRPLLAESEIAVNSSITGSTSTSSNAGAPTNAAVATQTQAAGPTRIADWLRRTSRPLLESSSKVRCLLRSHAGGGGGGGGGSGGEMVRQRSIRRSRKENNVSQSMQDGSGARLHKGILKKRGSLKQKPPNDSQPSAAQPPLALEERPAPAATPFGSSISNAPPPAPVAPANEALPRKGILKKPAERESGYYSSSSSSPESSDSAQTPQPPLCPSVPPRRKGILKRNGKFSSGGLQEFGSLDQLAASLPQGVTRVRPSGAVSEDSILSSESFDRLDLPDRETPTAPMEKPARSSGNMRGCVSADNLLDLREDCGIKGQGHRRLHGPLDMACYLTPGMADSAFSISDCQNVTQAFRQNVVTTTAAS